MLIRRAQVQDAPDLFLCAVLAFRDYILQIDRTPGPMLEDYYEGIKQHTTFVAEIEDRIHGLILLKDGEEGVMWIDVLATDPTKAGQGIGRALLTYAQEYMISLGKTECRLYTHVAYGRTLSIYQRQGFTIYNRVQEYGYDRYYLKKGLKPQ